jgi:hypothetical protein
MRASTFADHMATCNTAGSCFVTNDSPFPFVGSVSVRVLNVLTGVSVNQTLEPVSLPAGPKLSHWFCAEKPHASVSSGDVEDDDDASSSTLLRATAATPGTKHTTQGADDDAPAPYKVIAALPSDRNNISKTLAGKAASVAACEAACNADPKCLGFTKYVHGAGPGSWRNDCWLYEVVPSLVSNAAANWHQKPGTKPIPHSGPIPPPPPTPPAPPPPHPAPAPPAPSPYPEPAPLNCSSWAETKGWKQAGCNANGGNCVLLIDVYRTTNGSGSSSNHLDASSSGGSGALDSWTTIPFQPPKHMVLAPANVTWSLGQASADGSHVTISLTSNATALYVVLTTAAQGRFSDNAFLLESSGAGAGTGAGAGAGAAAATKEVDFLPWDGPLTEVTLALLRSTLRVEHLAENV